jgi:hypothetical protein
MQEVFLWKAWLETKKKAIKGDSSTDNFRNF